MLGQFAPICKVYNSHSDIHDSPVKVCENSSERCLRVVCFTGMITPPCDNTQVCVCVSDKASLS